jgi:hypothetical protein
MIDARFVAAALLAGAAVGGSLAPQHAPGAQQQAVLAEFAARVQHYMDVRDLAAATVPAQTVSADPAQIRRITDALAAAIRTVRVDARQGDIFTPGIAAAFRAAIGSGCHDQYAELLAIVSEELESPLPAPVVHGRWPAGVPVPTMPPDLLVALPWLPPGLQYRFVNRDLVLIDIDANLIVDFVPDAIPVSTAAATSRRP